MTAHRKVETCSDMWSSAPSGGLILKASFARSRRSIVLLLLLLLLMLLKIGMKFGK